MLHLHRKEIKGQELLSEEKRNSCPRGKLSPAKPTISEKQNEFLLSLEMAFL